MARLEQIGTEDGWRSQLKLFGKDSLNALDRWRMEMDQLEQERARSRGQSKREQERHERSLARAGAREEIAALRAELATLRAEHESLCRTLSETMGATASAFGTLADERREQHAAIDDLKLQIARLGASPEAKRAAFQFAREKSDTEIIDLPDFIRKTH